MTDTATAIATRDEFSALLNVEGAQVHINAPSFDLLSALIAKFKADAPATKPSAGVSADEKAAVLGNAQSQPEASPSAGPAATPSAATTQAAASASDVTQDMVNKATIALVQKHGADKAKAILTSFGLAKASEATAKCPGKFAEIHAALTAALEG